MFVKWLPDVKSDRKEWRHRMRGGMTGLKRPHEYGFECFWQKGESKLSFNSISFRLITLTSFILTQCPTPQLLISISFKNIVDSSLLLSLVQPRAPRMDVRVDCPRTAVPVRWGLVYFSKVSGPFWRSEMWKLGTERRVGILIFPANEIIDIIKGSFESKLSTISGELKTLFRNRLFITDWWTSNRNRFQ